MAKQKEIRWADSAWQEFLRILQFYDEQNQSSCYSEKLETAVWKKLEQVRQSPEWGEWIPDETARRVIVGYFVLLYEIHEDAIVVIVFRDGRRDEE